MTWIHCMPVRTCSKILAIFNVFLSKYRKFPRVSSIIHNFIYRTMLGKLKAVVIICLLKKLIILHKLFHFSF